jgi:hypothetical protein
VSARYRVGHLPRLPGITIVVLLSGKQMPFLLIALMLFTQARPLGVLTGQIRHTDGTPAPGVRVALVLEKDASEPIQNISVSDAQGRYRIEGIEPGSYLITMGARVSPTYYPGVRNIADARPVRIAAGETMLMIDLQSPKPVRATGRISGLPPGFPPDQLRVVLLPVGELQTPATFMANSQSVQPDGRFSFPSLRAGSYSYFSVPPLMTRRGQIEVGDQDLELPDLVFQHSVWGRALIEEGGDVPFMQAMAAVSTAPIRFLTFRITHTDPLRGVPGQSTSAIVFESGIFAVSPTAGEYQLTRLETPLGYTVKSMTYGTVDLLQGLPFTIVDSTKPTEIRMTLAKKPPAGPLRKVSGHVEGVSVDQAGWVEIQSADSGVPRALRGEAVVRSDGSFQFENVPPGDYILHFRKGFDPGQIIAVTVGTADLSGITLPMTSPPPPPRPQPGARGTRGARGTTP